ncbi:MAG: 2-dehydropantoate 2-reductase, partial [Clostridia bacterium]|nr:2-dehydropantoate 2-reductase [Clostridia bacterium]
MHIAILGAGAMGSLFGGYLSQRNEVWLIDVNERRVRSIAERGVCIREPSGSERLFHPHAAAASAGLPQMDLVIVFVKAMHTLSALNANQSLIGGDTRLMTLQNGRGHEEKLLRFADADHVIIGTTQHNSSILDEGHIHHGGSGQTTIGLIGGDSGRIADIAEAFCACGLQCAISDHVKAQIWKKLFLNTSASALTAVLQMPLGFCLEDPHARALLKTLIGEAVAVANAEDAAVFDAEQVTRDVETALANARNGYTSIYADIRDGRRTEVDTLSGSVVDSGRAYGVPVPCHETIVALIRAVENRRS